MDGADVAGPVGHAAEEEAAVDEVVGGGLEGGGRRRARVRMLRWMKVRVGMEGSVGTGQRSMP